MSQMNELYAKVAGDAALQAKFAEIMKDPTADKLTAFAKDAGYDVTGQEAIAYFAEKGKAGAELDDAELDMVAGGKASPGEVLDDGLGRINDFFNNIGDAFTNLFK